MQNTRAFTIIGNGIPTQLTKAVMGGVLDSAYEQTHDGKKLFSDRDAEVDNNNEFGLDMYTNREKSNWINSNILYATELYGWCYFFQKLFQSACIPDYSRDGCKGIAGKTGQW